MLNVELIEKLIEKHGINWSILARSIGVTRQSMDYVKKQRKTSHDTLQKIAEYFSVDAKTLLSANADDNTTLITTDMGTTQKEKALISKDFRAFAIKWGKVAGKIKGIRVLQSQLSFCSNPLHFQRHSNRCSRRFKGKQKCAMIFLINFRLGYQYQLYFHQ